MEKTFDQGRAEVVKLCKYFETNRQAFLAPGVKEAHVRQTLIDPFLEALGWDVRNAAMLAPQYREVVTEDSLDVEGHQKAPDYAFRVGTLTKFFAEAKKCTVNITSDQAPAYQLRSYGWSAKVGLSLLTSFEELSIYDCASRPRPTDKAARARIEQLKFKEYPDKWRELWDVFSREAIWAGAFDQYAASKRKRGTSEVDIEFLKEIEGWRDLLARNIALRNEDLSSEDLNSAVQRTIDRIVFLRMAEDRGIEPYGQLLQLADQENAYSKFMSDLCRRADEKYNSGLFHFQKEQGTTEVPDKITPKLKLDDRAFKPILQSLYFEHGSPYRFRVLAVEILGTIYERFLGKVIRLTNAHQAKIEDKPEVRKAGGVYYTPSFIVDYIVAHTVGKAIENKSPTQLAGGNAHSTFRVMDMACGSGSFLLGAYQLILAHFLKWYVDHKPETNKKAVHKDPSGQWRLTIAEKKRILTTHIFGVDIDPQAAEVSKLSLLLKALEGENEASLSEQLLLFHERALPNLSNNIKCGNSLVEADFLSSQLIPDGLELERVNAFDWGKEFPEIMQVGGFDCIIGNPPYAYRNATEEKLRPYYLEHYRCSEGNFDLYKFFLERATMRVRPQGRIGFIVSATFLVQHSFRKLRSLLLQLGIERLAPLGPNAFVDATVDTAILILKRERPRAEHRVVVQAPAQPSDLIRTREYAVSQSRFLGNDGYVFDYRLGDEAAKIVARLMKTFPPIESGYDFGVGINTGYIRDELVADHKVNKSYHPMVAGDGISRYGSARSEKWIMYDKDYVRSRGKLGRTLPAEHLLSSEKILVVRTRNLSLNRRIVATLDRSGVYNLNRLSNIVARSGNSLAGLLGILCSHLFNWLYSTRFYDYEIKPVYLRKSPLADANSPKLVAAVEQMLELHQRKEISKDSADQARLQRLIESTDSKIDALVYELYGLDTEEIEIIKDAFKPEGE